MAGTSYGVCETTNVFLNILLLSKAKGPFGERVAKALGPLQTVNGLLLWVSFFVFRVLLFPWVLYTCYRDWTRMGERKQPLNQCRKKQAGASLLNPTVPP